MSQRVCQQHYHTIHQMLNVSQSGSKYPRKSKMEIYPPGIVHLADVDGKKRRVYLTIESIGMDLKPKWRYAPGDKNQHELVDGQVNIIDREFRFSMDMKKYRK